MRVTVNVTEAQTRSFRAGAGWGTLDCLRAQAKWIDRSPFGLGQRLEINGRVSKIGKGSPLGFAPGLCPGIDGDPFSEELNYFGSATLNFTDLFGRKLSPALTFYSEIRSEPFAYRRETPIGARLSFSAPIRPSVTGSMSATYEYGKTIADEALSCLVFNACTADEFQRQQNFGSLGVIGLGATWDLTHGQIFQVAGLRARIESRTGFANLSQSADVFDRFLAEASYFRPMTPSVTLAARIQVGAISKFVTTSGTSVPLQERFFAGGLSSVRGYAQNQLGDVVYLMSAATDTVARDPVAKTVTLVAKPTDSKVRTSPVGGEAMFVGNLELRIRDPRRLGPFQLAVFMDAGQVRPSGDQAFQLTDIRYTPGFGARMETAFGLFRLDIGYNGYDVPLGPAYLIVGPASGKGTVSLQRLLCVSPGTQEQYNPVTFDVTRPAGSVCPSNFAPVGGANLFERLVFHFGIGHAF
jgi:outer membrane protein assembly factor BamA